MWGRIHPDIRERVWEEIQEKVSQKRDYAGEFRIVLPDGTLKYLEAAKLDLVVTLDFRMSTSCLYSDIVLPTASWYERHDLNTRDMHPFIHPFSAAADPVWESHSDWEIYKTIARRFSELAPGHLGVERDGVLTPILHDTRASLHSHSRCAIGRKANASSYLASPRRRSLSSSATIPIGTAV